MRILVAFAPLLDASASPVVVNVSSSVGSLAMASDEQGPYAGLNLLAYPASKAALNMLTIQWAKAHPRWRVNSADPGFTATDLNQFRGTQTIEEGTDAIVRLTTAGPDGPTGGFFGRDGTGSLLTSVGRADLPARTRPGTGRLRSAGLSAITTAVRTF